jgi:hypothetical protein
MEDFMADNTFKKIMEVYGVTVFDKWIRLPQISILFLEQDGNLYLDPDTQIFYFDSSNKMIYISESPNYVNIKTLDSSLKSYPISVAAPMSKVVGAITSSVKGPFGAYIPR